LQPKSAEEALCFWVVRGGKVATPGDARPKVMTTGKTAAQQRDVMLGQYAPLTTRKVMTTGKAAATPKVKFFANC